MASAPDHLRMARSSARGWMVLVSLFLCRWSYSPLQVRVAAPILRAVWEPPSLDPQKVQACAPKLLETDQLKDLIAEAQEPKWKPRKKPKPRTSPERPGLWRCRECEQWLPATAFYVQKRRGMQFPDTYCKECRNEKLRLHRRTLRGGLLDSLHRARHRAKGKAWNVTLTFEDVLEMVEQQNGRCAYSGVPMEMVLPNSHWRMSLERLNNSEGYSRENCVLIAGEFNTGDFSRPKGVQAETVKGSAQWSPEKVQDVFRLRDHPVDTQLLQTELAEARLGSRKSRSAVVHQNQSDKDEAGNIYCSACDMFLSSGSFPPSQRAVGTHCCKACMREYGRARRSTLRGHVQECLNTAKTNSKKRGQEFSLSLLQVLDMLEKQSGRCFYSGVPLEYKRIHTPRRLSIERLDNSIGYTVENCVLIAIEFNTSDHSRNIAVTEVFGTAQWSKEKVDHVWGLNGWARERIPPTLT